MELIKTLIIKINKNNRLLKYIEHILKIAIDEYSDKYELIKIILN